MKRKTLIAIMLLFITMLSGCSYPISRGISHGINHVYGYSNFIPHDYDKNYSYDPNYNFLTEFQYTDADYVYMLCDGLIPYKDTIEIGFIYIVYEKTIYEEAKAYSLGLCKIDESLKFDYNDYHFNAICRSFAEIPDFEYLRETFPYVSRIFCYNDEKNTLIFADFILKGKGKEKYSKTYEDDGYLVMIMSLCDFYDFDAEDPYITDNIELKTF